MGTSDRVRKPWELAPDATTRLKPQCLLKTDQLTESIFNAINVHVADKGHLLREGTIADATLIAPRRPSTKDQEQMGDNVMLQTKKLIFLPISRRYEWGGDDFDE